MKMTKLLMAVMAAAVLSVAAIAMAATAPPVDVTVSVTPAQIRLIQWHITRPGVVSAGPRAPAGPSNVREYIEQLITSQLTRVRRDRLAQDKADFDEVLKTADAAKCQAIADAMGVDVTTLTCGGEE